MRIQDYEQHGAQASLELQLAARKIAWENERLRSLLVSKGVTRQEIEDHLRSCTRGVVSPSLVRPAKDIPLDSAFNSPPAVFHFSHRILSSEPDGRQDVSLIVEGSGSKDTLPNAETDDSIESVQLPVQADPHAQASSTDDLNLPNSMCETSCEVAANIIANMRWHRDTEEARVELGCDGAGQCTVKNTTVFHIMDMN